MLLLLPCACDLIAVECLLLQTASGVQLLALSFLKHEQRPPIVVFEVCSGVSVSLFFVSVSSYMVLCNERLAQEMPLATNVNKANMRAMKQQLTTMLLSLYPGSSGTNAWVWISEKVVHAKMSAHLSAAYIKRNPACMQNYAPL